mmetsp:Transcript_12188/g.29764  ORF Transcript_12188/g.29764 Transcript_12188/m.29764 type:complete len:283 (-) Transcript_12188:421-1269(-)
MDPLLIFVRATITFLLVVFLSISRRGEVTFSLMSFDLGLGTTAVVVSLVAFLFALRCAVVVFLSLATSIHALASMAAALPALAAPALASMMRAMTAALVPAVAMMAPVAPLALSAIAGGTAAAMPFVPRGRFPRRAPRIAAPLPLRAIRPGGGGRWLLLLSIPRDVPLAVVAAWLARRIHVPVGAVPVAGAPAVPLSGGQRLLSPAPDSIVSRGRPMVPAPRPAIALAGFRRGPGISISKMVPPSFISTMVPSGSISVKTPARPYIWFTVIIPPCVPACPYI